MFCAFEFYALTMTIKSFILVVFCYSNFIFHLYGQTRNFGANCPHYPGDFLIEFNACNQYQVSFENNSLNTLVGNWDFGDGSTATGDSVAHIYNSPGEYTVTLIAQNKNGCFDTTIKKFGLAIDRGNIFSVKKITDCTAAPIVLPGDSTAFSNCWSPGIYLDSSNNYNPVCTPVKNISYQYNIVTKGNNIVPNGNFKNGNTNFNTDYLYSAFINTDGYYFVGNSAQQWNSSYSNCTADSIGIDSMLIINGATNNNKIVWSKNISVLPQTNYELLFDAQSLTQSNGIIIQITINNGEVTGQFKLPNISCNQKKFRTTWYSSSDTGMLIKFICLDTSINNNFSLDNIIVRPVFLKSDSLTIDLLNLPQIIVNNDTSVCSGSSVQLFSSSATAINYNWSPSAGLNFSNIAQPVATPAGTVTYHVTVTDANQCKNTDSVQITVLASPVVSLTNDTVICKGSQIQLSASGGNFYTWSPSAGLSDSTISNPISTPTNTIKYYLVVTDNKGCKTIDSVKISIKQLPAFGVQPAIANVCIGDSLLLTASGGDTYNWFPSSTVSQPDSASTYVFPSKNIIYEVIIKENTCNITDSLFTAINVNAKPVVTTSKTNDVDCSFGQATLHATGGVKYLWQPPTTLTDVNSSSTVATPSQTTTYYVLVSNLYACTTKDSIQVNVSASNGSNAYLMPSAFTPNKDGLNDCFGIKKWGYTSNLQFKIYNRWGILLFSGASASSCWDGTYKGIPQPAGTYIYEMQAKTLCGNVFRKGTVVLIK